MVWNLSTRSPLEVLRDIAAGVRSPGTLLRGTASLLTGLLLLVGGLSLLLPLLLPRHAFLLLGSWAAVSGLLVEQLIGPDLYGRRSDRSKR